MPIYNFKCPKCNKEEEYLVPFDTKKYKCECGTKMIRQFSTYPSNFIMERHPDG